MTKTLNNKIWICRAVPVRCQSWLLLIFESRGGVNPLKKSWVFHLPGLGFSLASRLEVSPSFQAPAVGHILQLKSGEILNTFLKVVSNTSYPTYCMIWNLWLNRFYYYIFSLFCFSFSGSRSVFFITPACSASSMPAPWPPLLCWWFWASPVRWPSLKKL